MGEITLVGTDCQIVKASRKIVDDGTGSRNGPEWFPLFHVEQNPSHEANR
jgi:hypothetical protein